MKIRYLWLLMITIVFFFSCKRTPELSGKYITIKYNQNMHSILNTSFSSEQCLMSEPSVSEYLLLKDQEIKDFELVSVEKNKLENDKGQGLKLNLIGDYIDDQLKIRKVLGIEQYDDFPNMLFTTVSYVNLGSDTLSVLGWINNAYTIEADTTADPDFWSYQSGSYASRPDWVLPIEQGFKQDNYMGMNASDYGGGTPVSDVWRPDAGLAVGHVEPVPKLVSLPVIYSSEQGGAHIKIVYNKKVMLNPGDSLKTFKTFVAVHEGDFFQILEDYSAYMRKAGTTFDTFPEDAYEPIWCAWGYERNFKVEEVLATLPKVKELGFKWAVLDDGWQTAEGDWALDQQKFPKGDSDMKEFVRKIHASGLKAKLWWAPLAVDPGTKLINEHPELLLINESGTTQHISWWDSYYLCPAYEKTVTYTRDLVKKMIGDWDYDGLKIDGQHLNAVPPCYNPEHHHLYPEISVEKLPEFFKMIYETARSIKPNAVIEICPCGTAYAFHTMPYMNQPVSSDPTSSWQIRLKGKTLKGLMGRDLPYYGDHVELSDNGTDFASTVGIGAVVGTKFTWPEDRHEHDRYELTSEKELLWQKWVSLYKEHMLPKGLYMGELYDIGYDKPETHVIKKGKNLYYAFYSENFDGRLDLRGLDKTIERYEVIDYVADKYLGQVNSTSSHLDISFKNYLLVKCSPSE